ncbi:MAG: patatin-like phospholipase family protein, partial [Deltaproteobacteria bacterium]|nr:patatin-like phospholipase family protein [Deltaproteobacteria bacterium]
MRIGLALGGGAARGLAHLGVVETLCSAGIPVHVVAGTSMGALVGAMFAQKADATKMLNEATQ